VIDPVHFVAIFRAAALQAGAVARQLQGRVEVERKAGQRSPEAEAVTAVDRAAQDVLLLRLHESFPEVAVDAEEDTRSVRLFASGPERPVVVIDPVDGTLAYTRGSDDWAVMGALVVDGFYEAAVLEFPAHALTCWALRGGGCFVADAGRVRRVVAPPAAPERLLVTPLVAEAHRARLRDRLSLEVVRSRCSAVDATAPALGWARASLTEARADRRRSIGFLATLEAGGAVRFGAHRWRGEDPARLPWGAAPTVAADSEALAERILATP
jgi:fructose-1,6-bisphosphatase/inositol monophosphatase family enzyme